jgi:branched-chain amino acid transport system permease protein
VLFLVAAGLQLVFGVQRILNLACGSFYALGRVLRRVGGDVGARRGPAGAAVRRRAAGPPAWPWPPSGPPLERLLRTIYDRDESFQLLLTFALVLMLEDVIRFFWGTGPLAARQAYLVTASRDRPARCHSRLQPGRHRRGG